MVRDKSRSHNVIKLFEFNKLAYWRDARRAHCGAAFNPESDCIDCPHFRACSTTAQIEKALSKLD